MRMFFLVPVVAATVLASFAAEAVNRSFVVSGIAQAAHADIPIQSASNAYLSMFLYDQNDQEISFRIVGQMTYSGSWSGTTGQFQVRLFEGVQRVAFFLTDARGNKLHKGCWGSDKIDLLVNANRKLNIVIRNLCVLNLNHPAISGAIQFKKDVVQLNSNQKYRVLVEVKTQGGGVVRSKILGIDSSTGLEDINYFFNDLPKNHSLTVCACIIDENGKLIYCGCFGSGKPVKFTLESGESQTAFNILIANCPECTVTVKAPGRN